MLINVDKVLCDFEGTALPNGKEGDFTLKDAAHTSLLSDPAQNLNGTEKYKRYELAKKIHKAKGDIDLSIDELALLKGCIDRVYPQLVYGLCMDILEGKN